MKKLSLFLLLTLSISVTAFGQSDSDYYESKRAVDHLIEKVNYFYQAKKDSVIHDDWLGLDVSLNVISVGGFYEVEIRPTGPPGSLDSLHTKVQNQFAKADTLDGGYYWENGWAPSHMIRYEADRQCYVFYEPYISDDNEWYNKE